MEKCLAIGQKPSGQKSKALKSKVPAKTHNEQLRPFIRRLTGLFNDERLNKKTSLKTKNRERESARSKGGSEKERKREAGSCARAGAGGKRFQKEPFSATSS